MGSEQSDHMRPSVTTTRSMRVLSTMTRVGDLRAFLEGADGDATVTCKTEAPDRPGTLPSTTFTITTQEQP